MYRISEDPARHRVIVEFIDTFVDIDQDVLGRDLRAASLRAKGAGACFDMIADFSRTSIMPQHTTASGKREIEWAIANGLRRSANVTGSTIAKMQLQRLADTEHFRTFATRAEAEAWLAED